MASYFSYYSERKVTKRTPPRPVCPAGSLTIQLCLRAALTRRPGSTGLNPTSMSAISLFLRPYQSRMARQTSRGYCLLPLSRVAWMKRSVIREFLATLNSPGLQNTSMYSALRACVRSSNSIQLNLVTSLHPGYDLMNLSLHAQRKGIPGAHASHGRRAD